MRLLPTKLAVERYIEGQAATAKAVAACPSMYRCCLLSKGLSYVACTATIGSAQISPVSRWSIRLTAAKHIQPSKPRSTGRPPVRAMARRSAESPIPANAVTIKN
jgi:hypothetical protein